MFAPNLDDQEGPGDGSEPDGPTSPVRQTRSATAASPALRRLSGEGVRSWVQNGCFLAPWEVPHAPGGPNSRTDGGTDRAAWRRRECTCAPGVAPVENEMWSQRRRSCRRPWGNVVTPRHSGVLSLTWSAAGGGAEPVNDLMLSSRFDGNRVRRQGRPRAK